MRAESAYNGEAEAHGHKGEDKNCRVFRLRVRALLDHHANATKRGQDEHQKTDNQCDFGSV
jgi:hypothetical protein